MNLLSLLNLIPPHEGWFPFGENLASVSLLVTRWYYFPQMFLAYSDWKYEALRESHEGCTYNKGPRPLETRYLIMTIIINKQTFSLLVIIFLA